MNIERFGVVQRRSEMVLHEQTLYIGGQVASDTGADIEGQTREILQGIEHLLAGLGGDRTHLLTVRILLADRDDYAGLNRVWDEFFPLGHAPARACTLAQLIDPAWRVEMIATAALPPR
ncbi:RidA family protein [Pseudomonas sp. CAN2814]|uniref:RidA family protein n=1 Tax=Pseudomonas sp. CAN1 TaxID=3046726 RepID=UPI0026485A6C|nr:RidA family protein [Pseudomonas sp. CAN1]MDN6861006.1 RidA family protein [Pseudomonas sp. CAN1]